MRRELKQIAAGLSRKQWPNPGGSGSFAWAVKITRDNAIVLVHPGGLLIRVANISLVPANEGEDTGHPAVTYGIRRHVYQASCTWELKGRRKSAVVVLANPTSREPFLAGIHGFAESDANLMLRYFETIAVALFADELTGKRLIETAREPTEASPGLHWPRMF